MGIFRPRVGQSAPWSRRSRGATIASPTKEAAMPNGIFPIPAFKTVPPRQASARSPLRMRTRWQRSQLDEQIAGGAETTATAELNLRAAPGGLRDALRVDGRGGAMAARLVRDRKGPLRSTDGGDLREAVDSARH